LDESKEWLANDSETEYRVIEFQRVPVGYFRIGQVETRDSIRLLWIGCDIDQEYRRQGHAYNAYKSFIPHFLQEFDAQGLLLRVLPTNTSAQKLYQKLGFITSALWLTDNPEQRTTTIVDIEMLLGPSKYPVDFMELFLRVRNRDNQ
jgi:RimJ/RimL family protein N-acetyltransferase